MLQPIEVKTDKSDYTFYRINNDVNGNPRYVVHFLDLGISLKDYGNDKRTAKAGLKKYNTKQFGGGYVFQSYNLRDTANELDRIFKA